MAFDQRQLSRPFKKIRKELRDTGRRPEVEQVHQLRTHARRIQAVIQAVAERPDSHQRRLLRRLEQVRKGAGKVRDMDVLTSHVVQMETPGGEADCQVELLEYLAGKRIRYAHGLFRIVKKNRLELDRGLKRCRKQILKQVRQAENSAASEQKEVVIHALADALHISAVLAKPERLRVANLHEYRLEVKRLQYLLQLADGPHRDERFIDQLKQVKDAIGDWHDWHVLSGIAGKVLKGHGACKLIKKVESATADKFQQALVLTDKMRERYLQPQPVSKKKSKRKPPIAGPALVAATALAA